MGGDYTDNIELKWPKNGRRIIFRYGRREWIMIWADVSRAARSYGLSESSEQLDSLIYLVEKLLQMLVIVQSNDVVLGLVSFSLSVFEEIQSSFSINLSDNATPYLICGQRGCPHLDIQKNQLENLLHLQLTCPQVAKILRVSLSTMRRRMAYYNLSVNGLYSWIA